MSVDLDAYHLKKLVVKPGRLSPYRLGCLAGRRISASSSWRRHLGDRLEVMRATRDRVQPCETIEMDNLRGLRGQVVAFRISRGVVYMFEQLAS